LEFTSDEILASLGLFLVASFRFAPSLLRIQTSSLVMKSNSGLSQSILDISNFLSIYEQEALQNQIEPVSIPTDYLPEVQVKGVSFTHAESNFQIKDVSFTIPAGTNFAIVGPTGAGKSTLVDLLLGLNIPTLGEVKISGIHAHQVSKTWPGKIAYLPQEIMVLDGNIRDNIALVPNMSKVFDSRMIEILQRVKLEKLITQGNLGLDTRIGEGGILLSGGEKQRLGMARAIFSNAQLIVFDESTSSLDVITENAVADIFHSLKGICTVVVIAHRLSTIRNFDQIAYLSSGEVRAIADFNSLRNSIKDFDDQCIALDIR